MQIIHRFSKVKASTKNTLWMFLAGATLCTSLALNACSLHSNPLKKMNPEKASEVLAQASAYAKDTLHLYSLGNQDVYEVCVLQKTASKQDLSQETCEQVYQRMIDRLKTIPGLENIELADIKDKSFIQEHPQSYRAAQFDAG